MYIFDNSKKKEMKAFLYESCIHDSKLENIECNYKDDTIKIKIFNPIYNKKIDILFSGIEMVFSIKKHTCESRDTINAIVVEDDYSYLRNYLIFSDENMKSASI